MTKKDYIYIAGIIKEALNIREIALALCDYFEEENTRFDRDKFLTACGMVKSDSKN